MKKVSKIIVVVLDHDNSDLVTEEFESQEQIDGFDRWYEEDMKHIVITVFDDGTVETKDLT